MRHLATTLLPLVLAAAVLSYDGPGHQWARNHLGDAHFDPLDFVYYGLGIAIAYGLEMVAQGIRGLRSAHVED